MGTKCCANKSLKWQNKHTKNNNNKNQRNYKTLEINNRQRDRERETGREIKPFLNYCCNQNSISYEHYINAYIFYLWGTDYAYAIEVFQKNRTP